jgi:hypothetical protein
MFRNRLVRESLGIENKHDAKSKKAFEVELTSEPWGAII